MYCARAATPTAGLTVPPRVLGRELDPVTPPALLCGEAYADDLTVRIVPGGGRHLPEERPVGNQ
ncbi:hypothetical protein [Streptomyces violascens]|uniref:hypothetical protein n=1 Tax=Streptomyces violascens TaxID=67381 RepID=UPI0036BB7825